MKTKLLLSSLLVSAALFAEKLPRAYAPDIFPHESTVLFQGVSITHGGRLNDMNHYLGHGYQAEIAMRYLGYRPDLNLVFGNRGVSGDTSSNLVARWSTDAIPFTAAASGEAGVYKWKTASRTAVPDVLSILIGVNDHNRRPPWRVPVANYEQNLRKMIDAAFAANPKMKIVIGQPFRLPENTTPEFRAFQEAAERVANDYNLVFVPYQRLFSDVLLKENENPRWWCWDSVHPTYAGHMRMADFWLKTVADGFAAGRGNPTTGSRARSSLP